MQIISTGDNLHEVLKPVFWEKQEKYFNMSSAENFTQVLRQIDTLSRETALSKIVLTSLLKRGLL